jgi:phosphoribosyl 1,2-cyclic phosphodiesterase
VRLVPLASGSRGNATLVEFGSTRLLVDAGLSARRLAQSLEQIGILPKQLDAILLSHEHEDHTRGAELFSRRHGTPVACCWETLEAMDRSPDHFSDWQALTAGVRFDLGQVSVLAFPVPHDAAKPFGFVIEGDGLRVGMVTDLGHATTLVRERLHGCEVLMVESNHDDRMLRDGPYPWHLKQRVSGRLGHLSNREASAMLRQTMTKSCRAVVLAHLSEKNNTPALARQAASNALATNGRGRVEMRVASPKKVTPPICL